MDVKNANISLGASLSPEAPLAEGSVSWRLAFWLLVTIAISSMAQRSRAVCNISRRRQIYLSSSPIICAADGLTLIVANIVLCVQFGFSSVAASCLNTQVLRLDHHEQRSAWPRRLFFLLATLPSAIILFSFSGVPWTQAFALMFLSSFIVNESATFIASFCHVHDGSVHLFPLDELLSEPVHRESYLRTICYIRRFEVTMLVIACATHLALGIWAVIAIWPVAVTSIRESVSAQDFGNGVMWISFFILLISTILKLIFIAIGKSETATQYGITLTFKWSLKTLLMFVLYFPRPGRKMGVLKIDGLFGLMWLAFGNNAGYKLLVWACQQWPAVGKALLVLKEPKIQTQEDGDKLADSEETKVAKEVKETETETETETEAKIDTDEGNPVDGDSALCLSFFLTSLVVCATWYGLNYDPTGTISPAWASELAKGWLL